MVTRPKISKYLLIPIFWFLSILILIILTANNELNTLYNEAVSCSPELRFQRNQLGALSYIRRDPKENGRPLYSACFKNLLVENNRFGIFKTGLHKVVKLQDLEFRFYRYTSPKLTSTTRLNNSKCPETATGDSSRPYTATVTDIFPIPQNTATDARTLIGIVDKLVHPKDGWRVNIDLSNVSGVRANNFDYEVFYDGDFFFGVQSKRAIASTKQSGLVLRGHVTIKTADGSTLESNYIEWDIENQRFTVKGIYVLNRNGRKTIGKGICVDAQLNVLNEQHAKSEGKESKRCLAKL